MRARAFFLSAVGVALITLGCGQKNPTGSDVALTPTVLLKTGPVQLTEVEIAVEMVQLVSVLGEAAGFTSKQPFIVDLNLTGNPTSLGNFNVLAGTYDSLKIKVHKLPGSGNSGFTQFSVRIQGTVDDNSAAVPFMFEGDVTTVLEEAFLDPLIFLDSSANLVSRVAMLVDLSGWFLDKRGGFLDPRDPNNQKQIEKNIEISIRDSGAAVVGQLFKGIAAALPDDDRITALAVHEDGSEIALLIDELGEVDGAIFVAPDGNTFTVFLGDDGLPAVASANENVFVFGNYTENSVDVAGIAPDGTIHVLRDISVDPDQLEFLRTVGAGQTSGQAVQLEKLAAFGLNTSQQLKLTGTALSVASCVSSALASIALPILVPAATLACAATVVTVGVALATAINPELEASLSGISIAASSVGCTIGFFTGPSGCLAFLVELTGEELRLAEILHGKRAAEKEEAIEQLTPPSAIAACPLGASIRTSGTLTEDTRITINESPCVINGIVTVPSGITLTVDPGVVLKFVDHFSGIDVAGVLNSIGTPADPIFFTSYKDDTVGGDTNSDGSATVPDNGDWEEVSIKVGGLANLQDTSVRYGQFNLQVLGTLIMDHSRSSYGVLNMTLIDPSADVTITSSEIDHARAQAGIFNTAGKLSITQSSIHDNAQFGVFGTNSVLNQAINNWWGGPTGPYNPNTNPGGLGNNGVSDNVDFIPFLTSDPVSAIP